MIGTSEIYKKLIASTAVKALVSKTGTSPNYVYKIETGVVEPDAWLVGDTTCLIYQSGADDSGEIYEVDHTVNCRAPLEKDSKALARAVRDALHRHARDTAFFYCAIQQTIGRLIIQITSIRL